MSPPALVLLQARMGSSRLPGKVLARLAEWTLLGHCIRRLTAAGVGPVVVATSVRPADDAIVHEAARWGVAVVRGPEGDVLARFAAGAAAWTGPFVIRATADNPAVDVEGPRRVLEALRDGADYAVEVGLPVGAAVEGMRTDALHRAAELATEPYDREHVTPFIRRRVDLFRVAELVAPAPLRRPDVRLTVDTTSDLARMREIMADVGGANDLATLAALITAADRLVVAGGLS